MKKKFLLTGLVLLALCAFIAALWAVLILIDLPDVSVLKHYRPSAAAEVLDRNGNVLTQYYDRKLRIWVPVTDVPDTAVHAVVTAEDDTFFDHKGVNYRATWDAFVHDVKKRRFARGGSTITQQMIKNVFLSREKTVSRKLREYILAREAEDILTKRQILEIYLNEVEWGENIYGIEAAGRYYFDKHSSELTLSEAALLAGMLPNPRYFNPYKRIEKARERQGHILANMLQAKLITGDEYAAAVGSPLKLRPEASGRFDFSALSGANGRPCYQKVLEHILLAGYGEHGLYRQGIKVRTTLDKTLQDLVASLGEINGHSAAEFPESIIAVKEGNEVRAIACTSDEDAVVFRLSAPMALKQEYGIYSISPESVTLNDIVVSSSDNGG